MVYPLCFMAFAAARFARQGMACSVARAAHGVAAKTERDLRFINLAPLDN